MAEQNNFHTNVPGHANKQAGRTSFGAGEILAERYKVENVLGIGGMGVVYKVEQIYLRKIFAMKTLEIEDATGMFARRFQQEGAAVSRLDHPNVIRIHDFGLLNGQTPFYVMDYINGLSLAELLKRRGSLEIDEALKIFIRVSMALKHAHDSDIVHRDIKPSNIMLQSLDFNSDNCVKIVDFGIAKLKTEGTELQNLTRTGDIFGSPLYMSPEQCLGIGVDHRTDVYSFGCALYEALTGSPPHVGENSLSTMIKHREQTAPSLAEGSLGKTFSPTIEAVVEKLLFKNPDERYQDFGHITEDLMALANGKKPLHAQINKDRKSPGRQVVVLSNGKTAQVKDAGSRLWMIFPILALAAVAFFAWYALRPAPKPQVVAKPVPVATTAVVEAPPDENSVKDSEPPAVSPEIQELYDDHQVNIREETDRNFDHAYPYCTECTNRKGKRVRLFQFPNKITLGRLEFGHKHYPAQGDVLITEQGQFSFTASYPCCERPTFLDGFKPDEIDELDLGHKESTTDEVLSHISNWKGLKILTLSVSETSDRGLRSLEDLKIDDLRVNDTKITGKALAEMKILPQLKRLEANYIAAGAPALLKELGKSKSLDTLKLRYAKLQDDDLKYLKNVSTLKDVDVSENKQITDTGLKYINASNLRTIGMRKTSVTTEIFSYFETLPKLKRVVVEQEYPADKQALFHRMLPNIELELDSGMKQAFRMMNND